ncbi:inositol-3-phosphate synthase [Thermodesulfobacteriota bacterium]
MEQEKQIRIGIIGVGNCAASLLQGIEYYRHYKHQGTHLGLLHYDLGGYTPEDIEIVAAFDIDKRKVGKRVDQAIASPPNCVYPIKESIVKKNVEVKMGHILDGVSEHLRHQTPHRTFLPSDKAPADIVRELIDSKTEIVLNYLPVGSEQATHFYTECCLEAGVSLINCIPVFIVSDPEWAKRFEIKGIPCIGDDVKSQIGATIIHRTLVKLFNDRGIKLDRTYQLNTGGNTDFLNMLNRERLVSKKISKTEAVQSQLDQPMDDENIHIGPSDYVPWQKDNKVCFIRMEGRMFGGVPMDLELRASVEDSPNSAGVTIDAIRCCRIAMDRHVGGALTSISAFGMKHPPKQYSDNEAKELVHKFIDGTIER